MTNFTLVLIAIESILLTLIVLHLFRKISMSSRILEIVIILAIVLAIVINTLIVLNR